jgi:acetoin utilization deacetylase AcuC-like enzyme
MQEIVLIDLGLCLLTTDIVYHDIFAKHLLSPGHPESPERLKSAMLSIERAGLIDNSDARLYTPMKASTDQI